VSRSRPRARACAAATRQTVRARPPRRRAGATHSVATYSASWYGITVAIAAHAAPSRTSKNSHAAASWNPQSASTIVAASAPPSKKSAGKHATARSRIAVA